MAISATSEDDQHDVNEVANRDDTAKSDLAKGDRDEYQCVGTSRRGMVAQENIPLRKKEMLDEQSRRLDTKLQLEKLRQARGLASRDPSEAEDKPSSI